MIFKQRTCKDCKKEYKPFTFAQPRCKKCTLQKIKKAIKNCKPLKVKRNLLQEKVNKEARERDKDKPCISCGKFIKLEAGHFISVLKSKKLRYDLRNIHGQCGFCNRFFYGNYKAFRIGLIERYWIEFVEELENEL